MNSKSAILRICLSALLLLCLTPAAFTFEESRPPARRVKVPRFQVNFGELARREAEEPKKPVEQRVIPFLSTPQLPVPSEAQAAAAVRAAPAAPAPVPAPFVSSPSPASSFIALSDNNTVIPPDTQGSVGDNHVMTTLNSQIRITDRSGIQASLVTLGSFWASTEASGVFDPKLEYDPFNDRWIFTAVSNRRSAASSVLIGASQTSDPTGTWNLYRIDAEGMDVNWADYPSLGFNKDWVAVSVNMFAVSDDAFARSDIHVLRKSELYAGAMSVTDAVFNNTGGTLAPAVTYDNSLATLYLVQRFNGNSGGNGFLRISDISGAVGSEMLTVGPLVSTPNPWDDSPPSGADFAPQNGSMNKIQNNDSRVLKVIYRNNSLWASQTVFLPAGGSPTRSAAQWWQFTPAGTAQQFGRVDDPTGTVFRAFPTLAVNSAGDVMLGYSRFSASEFASAAYSFRAAGDTVNAMRDEFVLKAGEDSYFKTFSGTENRWGDYSNTVVDPLNDTDMWTVQEFAAFQVSGSSRWGTWWGKIIPAGAPPPPPTSTFSNTNPITINDSGSPPTTASPYPSDIVVSGLIGTITKVTAKLKGFSHTFPDDVDILLVGPTGTNLILMSDVGGGTDASGLDLTFADTGLPLPDSSPLASGTFAPTNVSAGADPFPSPAPVISANAALSVFNGTDPNGIWNLYVVDGFSLDSGSISMGWEITFETGNKRRAQTVSE